MLGLREEVCGDEVGACRVVREHDDLARPRDRVDADRAVDEPLRRGDVLVARPRDDIDARDGLRPVGQRGDGVRAADLIDLRHA